jgi:hypothetical protein
MEMDRKYTFIAHWMRSSSRPLLGLNVLMLAGLVYATMSLKLSDLLFVFPFFLLTLFYVFPGAKNFKGLRGLPGLKLFLIALVWAGMTVLFPLRAGDVPFRVGEWVVFIQRFLLILAITLPFDIRDLQFDAEGLATLPQTLGIANSKKVAFVALAAFALLFYAVQYFDEAERHAGIAIAFVSAAFVVSSGKYQRRYFSAFWVEAIPIAWYLLSFII